MDYRSSPCYYRYCIAQISVRRMNFRGKKALVLGLGISGRSACRYLLAGGAKVAAYDRKMKTLKELPDIKKLIGEGLKLIDEEKCPPADFMIVSPGISQKNLLHSQAVNAGLKVMGEAELAFSQMKNPVIGITGTNGKTTTAELTAHILNKAGKKAVALGNNGFPLTGWLLKENSPQTIVVAELSSYQMETMKTRVLDAAVILNISPDHLDRYGSLQNYAKAKFHIQNFLKPGAPFYIHPSLAFPYRSLIFRNALYTQEGLDFEQENQLASYQLVKLFGVSKEMFKRAAATFKKPPHRLEFVGKINGALYYNDSKATNVDSVMKAAGALPGKIILIAGGKDKGLSFKPLIEACRDKIRQICLIGEASERLYEELMPHFPTKRCETLGRAVGFCHSLAKNGECVLLSPGCASFDQYDNFEQRGDDFKKYVRKLGNIN